MNSAENATTPYTINVDGIFASFGTSNESSPPKNIEALPVDPFDMMIIRPRDKYKIEMSEELFNGRTFKLVNFNYGKLDPTSSEIKKRLLNI